jgi:DNA-binding winged helix-turn-helix (wHTH) protein
MKVLNYLQARERLSEGYSEEQIELILTVSGRAEKWLPIVAESVLAKESDPLALVESSGMGQSVMKAVPKEEWVYLVNPSLAASESWVITEGMIVAGETWSKPFAEWLVAQELGRELKLVAAKLSPDEAKVLRELWKRQEQVVEREELARAIWGESWTEQYSDWGLDAVIYRLRKKILSSWQIVTIKGRGYMLARSASPSRAVRQLVSQEETTLRIPFSIYPSEEYLSYMNDPGRKRKVYRDLLEALALSKIKLPNQSGGKILCVNSYSYDNVDSVVQWARHEKISDLKVFFVHYDPRALKMHNERILELGCASWMETVFDDMRESKVKDASMSLVINDFRLNFNQDHKQNQAMMRHIKRVLAPKGVALVSAVVDGRYENERYGINQEKAPLNKYNPGEFMAGENLVRRCWSVPYYEKLFAEAGFVEAQQFDVVEGREWVNSLDGVVSQWQGPFYRRWVLR